MKTISLQTQGSPLGQEGGVPRPRSQCCVSAQCLAVWPGEVSYSLRLGRAPPTTFYSILHPGNWKIYLTLRKQLSVHSSVRSSVRLSRFLIGRWHQTVWATEMVQTFSESMVPITLHCAENTKEKVSSGPGLLHPKWLREDYNIIIIAYKGLIKGQTYID